MYILIYSNFLTEDRQKISYECITDFVTEKQPNIFRNKKYKRFVSEALHPGSIFGTAWPHSRPSDSRLGLQFPHLRRIVVVCQS